jgi:hypothetical protein
MEGELALRKILTNSKINLALHLSTDGLVLLSTQSFLVVQILQVMTIMISMKNGTPRCLLILSKICGTDLVVGTLSPIDAQQALAKLQRRRR